MIRYSTITYSIQFRFIIWYDTIQYNHKLNTIQIYDTIQSHIQHDHTYDTIWYNTTINSIRSGLWYDSITHSIWSGLWYNMISYICTHNLPLHLLFGFHLWYIYPLNKKEHWKSPLSTRTWYNTSDADTIHNVSIYDRDYSTLACDLFTISLKLIKPKPICLGL